MAREMRLMRLMQILTKGFDAVNLVMLVVHLNEGK